MRVFVNFFSGALRRRAGLVVFGALILKPQAGAAQAHEIHPTTYPTRGNPTSAASTQDGRYVFVSVTNVGQPNFDGADSVAGSRKDAVSGIEVFRFIRSRNNKRGLESVAFVRTGSTGANGLKLLAGERTLVVGVGDEGVAFLDVHDLIHGKGTPHFAAQTKSAGTFDVVATPDGKFVFAANEYGAVDGQRGSVGIIATHIDRHGRPAKLETLGQIAVGDVVPSLTLSPDGARLYVASELVRPQDAQSVAGAGNPQLSKTDCVQRRGTPSRPNGYISVIDTGRAVGLEENAVLARVASGCSPVRLVETADAKVLFVSARGDDRILTFDPRVLEQDPEHAFLRSIPSGGSAPVGMRLVANDRFLAVANSNRFAGANGNLAILDLVDDSRTTQPRILPAGGFPRNLSLSADRSTLFLTNYTSRSLEVIQISGQ
jgi:6-phosphogluconolactonase (cycloisomerase 2 family)